MGEGNEVMDESNLFRTRHGVKENWQSSNDRKISVKGGTEGCVQRKLWIEERRVRGGEQL